MRQWYCAGCIVWYETVVLCGLYSVVEYASVLMQKHLMLQYVMGVGGPYGGIKRKLWASVVHMEELDAIYLCGKIVCARY